MLFLCPKRGKQDFWWGLKTVLNIIFHGVAAPSELQKEIKFILIAQKKLALEAIRQRVIVWGLNNKNRMAVSL